MIGDISLSSFAYFMLSQKVPNQLNPQLKNGDAHFTRVSTDTRNLEEGDLFFALRGEKYDAHHFLAEAADKKPCALVVEKYSPSINLPQLVVSDTTKALGQLGALNRSLFDGVLVAITGSSGKTTVKTMVASILEGTGETLATKGNLNNHIGVPLTLIDLKAEHQFAVVEMGASGSGEIAYSCSLARPQVSMINNVMPAHIQGFGSLEGVAKAKSEIYEGLVQGGIAIINLDDGFASEWLKTFSDKKIITVSLNDSDADFHAELVRLRPGLRDDSANSNIFDTLKFDLLIKGRRLPIQLNAQGEHSVRNALMAAACCYALGVSDEKIQAGLERFNPVGGRLCPRRGLEGSLVIDDTYNANPGSVRAAIDVLAKRERSILVLGDIAELGDESEQLHAELGEYAKRAGLTAVFTLGVLSEATSRAFGKAGQHFNDRAKLIARLRQEASAATTFLIKGSRSARMELVVGELCDALGGSH